MAKNTIWDLSQTHTDNTDIGGQPTTGSANANTIDSMLQKLAAVLAGFAAELGGTGTVGGTADAITLTTSASYPISALTNGTVVALKAGSANTGAATINVDTTGFKAIRRQGDSALSANDIVANGVYLLRYDTAYNGGAGAWVLLNPTNNLAIAGTNEAFIPAGAFFRQATNGAAEGWVELATTLQPLETLDFDTTTQEFAVFPWVPPKRWDLGTITYQAYWTAASGSGTAGFLLEGVAISNDDTLNTAYGTAVAVIDTLIAANDLHISPVSSAVTIAGTPADADLVWLRIKRDVSTDTLGVDAKLIGVKIFYMVDQGNDA